MKRIIVLSLVWSTLILVLLAVPLWLLQNAKPMVANPRPDGNPPDTVAGPSVAILMSTGVVIVIFAVDIVILWVLTKLGGRLQADVRATIKRFGGSIFIAGAGLMGCFLAIAFVAFGAIYLLAKLMG